jgi:hypothetical protein
MPKKKPGRATTPARGKARAGSAPPPPRAGRKPGQGASSTTGSKRGSGRPGAASRAKAAAFSREGAARPAPRGEGRRPASAARAKVPRPPAPRRALRAGAEAWPAPAAAPPPGDWLGAGLTEEEQIESAKYLPRRLPPRVFEEERFVFPASYGVNRIRLLVKDPYWLFAHWDLDPASVEKLREEAGERAAALSRLTLKVIDAANGGGRVILLPEGARSWYIRADSAPRTYRAELGITLPSGEFRGLASSNTVATPPVGAAPGRATRRRRLGRAPAPPGTALPPVPSPTRRRAREEWSPEPPVEDATTPPGRPPAGGAPAEATGPPRGGASDTLGPPRPFAPGDRGGASDLHRR